MSAEPCFHPHATGVSYTLSPSQEPGDDSPRRIVSWTPSPTNGICSGNRTPSLSEIHRHHSLSPKVSSVNVSVYSELSSNDTVSSSIDSWIEVPAPCTRNPSSTICEPDLLSTSFFSGDTSDTTASGAYDLLTVFQAAPLAYQRSSDGLPVALPTLNFDFERQVLSETIEEACNLGNTTIDVDFQIATMDRLGFFLARQAGEIMHFSCHGSEE
jgi:hypothetical protein